MFLSRLARHLLPMKILFLQKRLILPADTGGKIRTCNVVKHLAKWHEVTYLCNLLDQERPWLAEMEQSGTAAGDHTVA